MKFRELLMSATGVQREVVNDKGKKEMKWFGAVDPFDSVTIASVCMKVFRTKFIEEEWRVKLEGKNEWIPAKLMDEKLYVLRDNKWIHETELMGEKVRKNLYVRLSQKSLPVVNMINTVKFRYNG